MSSPKPKTGSEVPVSEAINLLNLINYQEGSIVTRTIVSREKGNVTLFAFDETQGLSEHTAPFGALVRVLEGEVEVAVDSKPLRHTWGISSSCRPIIRTPSKRSPSSKCY